MGQAQFFHATDVALIGPQFAQKKRKQAGFSTAVGANQSEPLTGLDRRIGAFEQRFTAPAQVDIA